MEELEKGLDEVEILKKKQVFPDEDGDGLNKSDESDESDESNGEDSWIERQGDHDD